MTANNTKNNDHYRKAREEFDSLKIEEKAIFLVESAFSMLARGIEAVGSVFSEQIDKIYADEDETAEPPKKTAPRKTSTRKKSTGSSSKRPSSRRSTKKTDTDAAS